MTPAVGTSKNIRHQLRGISVPNERHVLRQAKGVSGAGLHPEIAAVPKKFWSKFQLGMRLEAR